jgi:hypothetical protein
VRPSRERRYPTARAAEWGKMTDTPTLFVCHGDSFNALAQL